MTDAVIEDLQRLSAETAYDTNFAFALGFAMLKTSRFDNLRELASRLPALEQPTHNYHFNAGQLFMAAGDTSRGVRSLRLALALATDEEVAADAREALDSFGIQPD
jgi:hypothetical protein